MRFLGAAYVLALSLACFSACTALESGSDRSLAAGGAGVVAGGGGVAGGTVEPGSGGLDRAAGAGGQVSSNGGDASAGSAGADCPALSERKLARLAEAGEQVLVSDTTWNCQNLYRLGGNVIVAPGVTLTIEPGTLVSFDPEGMLLSQRGARLEANGTAESPITFTSAKAAGSRAPGDYRGVILIGDGPSHSTTLGVPDTLSDSRAQFGGGQAGKTAGSCGILRYVRVEFAGGSVQDAALPAGALTLAGCGKGTVVDHVQVHRATDGLGLLGGTVDLSHVLVTNNFLGEAIEWTGGYTGTMQFVVAQSLAASAAMQGSNSAVDAEASPVSRPTIFNATLVGSAPLVTGQHFGFLLQLGSRAVFKNSIVQGFADAAFDLRLDAGVLANEIGPGKAVDISHVLLHANSLAYSPAAAPLAGMESMRTQDPGLSRAAHPTPEMPDAAPAFAPLDPTVNTQPAQVPLGFDVTAGFRGGIPQDGVDWTLGWTEFPSN